MVDKVNVRIFTGYPGLLIRNDSVYKLRDQLKQKLAKNHRVLEISLVELSKPDGNAGILAEFIGQRLEERVPFRRVAKEVLDKVGFTDNPVFEYGLCNRFEFVWVFWALSRGVALGEELPFRRGAKEVGLDKVVILTTLDQKVLSHGGHACGAILGKRRDGVRQNSGLLWRPGVSDEVNRYSRESQGRCSETGNFRSDQV